MEILNTCGDFFDIYSGNDDIILPLLSIGARGVISVVSNITPSLVSSLCKEFFKGNTEEAKKLQLFLTPLIKEMFGEVNPIPIKTSLSIMGKCSDEFRLPLCKSSRVEKIKAILSSYSLI
jgi:4-hydroxy-tetrahydrodipicolinate synthase